VPVSDDDDRLLTPREVADIFDVRTTTVARWARAGRLMVQWTPGGHRRYRLSDVRAALGAHAVERIAVRTPEGALADVVRLYEQGWSIRRVAAEFEVSYGVMRRMLGRHVTMRRR
jgi:transposase